MTFGIKRSQRNCLWPEGPDIFHKAELMCRKISLQFMMTLIPYSQSAKSLLFYWWGNIRQETRVRNTESIQKAMTVVETSQGLPFTTLLTAPKLALPSITVPLWTKWHWMKEYIQITQQLIFLWVSGQDGDCVNIFPRMAFESEIKEQWWKMFGNHVWNWPPTERRGMLIWWVVSNVHVFSEGSCFSGRISVKQI